MSNNVMPEPQVLPKTAFRDLAVTHSTPVHAGSAQYGILRDVVPVSALGGSATSINSMFSCESGNSVGGFGAISIKGTLAFRPGQGEKDLFTARFSLGQAGSEQFAGLLNATSGAGWGYNGTEFGILLRSGGAIEVQELTITGAAGGGENATVTIDGTGYTVPLTSGTVQENALEVADSLTAQVPVWSFEQVDDQVIITSLIATPAIGSFSFTSATATGVFVQITAGILPTDVWTEQADWNGETMLTLAPANLNNYKIQFGPGVAFFSIFDSDTNEYLIAHVISANNTSPLLIIENPTFTHSWYALSRGGTSNVITEGGFAGLYREGQDTSLNATDSVQAAKTVGTTMEPLFSIMVRGSINGVLNEAIAIIKSIQVASDANKPIIATLILDADLVGENWQYINKTESILLVDTAATAVSGGRQLSITGFETIDKSDFESELRRAESFTLAVNVSSGGASDFSAVMTYLEDL